MFMVALARPRPDCGANPDGPDEPRAGKVCMEPFMEVGEFVKGPKAGSERILNVTVNRYVPFLI